MKKIKTDGMIIHVETVVSGGNKRIIIEVSSQGFVPTTMQFVIPNECSKQTISDTGLAKHILNYFIKE